MSTLDDLIARKKPAHADVDVYLDSETSERVQQLRDELESITDLRISDPRPKSIRDEIDRLETESAAYLVTFRFEALPGDRYAGITAKHFQRPGVALDAMLQYNYHDVAKEAAEASAVGWRQGTDGDWQPVSAEQWAALWPKLSGHEFEQLATVIINLNDWRPKQQVDSAKKALLAASAATSNSPTTSE